MKKLLVSRIQRSFKKIIRIAKYLTIALSLAFVIACTEKSTSNNAVNDHDVGGDSVVSLSSEPIVVELAESYSMDDFHDVRKIDAHVHVNTMAPDFLEQARMDNFQLFSINVDYPDFPPIEDQKSAALHWLARDGDVFQFAATFSMDDWDKPDWKDKVIAGIDESVAQGAKGIKVWKNIGMTYRDQNENLVMINDGGFDDIFSHMKNIDLPLIGHQGEPKNCWLPLEAMTVNNDRQYFEAHPEYHMYLHPEFPSYEDQMAARDSMLEKNSELPFMGAHMASLEWSVDELASFLDRYPNAVADLAARMGQVQYQSGKDGEISREKVRQFFIKYQDRILYASDLTSLPGDNPEEFRASVHKKWLEDWGYLNTLEHFSVPEVDHTVIGLGLPKSIANKIYYENAERFFDLNK